MTPEERAMETLREIITAARSKGADEAVQIYLAAIREAVKAEREASAQVASGWVSAGDIAIGARIAAAIRARTP